MIPPRVAPGFGWPPLPTPVWNSFNPVAQPAVATPPQPPETPAHNSRGLRCVAGNACRPGRLPRLGGDPSPESHPPTQTHGPALPNAPAVRAAAATPGTNKRRGPGSSRPAGDRSAAFPPAICNYGTNAPLATDAYIATPPRSPPGLC